MVMDDTPGLGPRVERQMLPFLDMADTRKEQVESGGERNQSSDLATLISQCFYGFSLEVTLENADHRDAEGL